MCRCNVATILVSTQITAKRAHSYFLSPGIHTCHHRCVTGTPLNGQERGRWPFDAVRWSLYPDTIEKLLRIPGTRLLRFWEHIPNFSLLCNSLKHNKKTTTVDELGKHRISNNSCGAWIQVIELVAPHQEHNQSRTAQSVNASEQLIQDTGNNCRRRQCVYQYSVLMWSAYRSIWYRVNLVRQLMTGLWGNFMIRKKIKKHLNWFYRRN